MTYTPKTQATDQPIEEFLCTVEPKRQEEAKVLLEMMQRVSGEKPRMWGPSMIGFGTYHYKSKSNCEGDWFKIGFSPRKAKLSLYLSCDANKLGAEFAKLGKHSRGAGCIYVNKLDDIDLHVLEKIAETTYANTTDTYA